MDDLAVSRACLQACASPALPCGVAAASFHILRAVSMLAFTVARIASGTLLLTHASYFEMYSSHSGTPILSPLVPAVEVFAAALLPLPAAALELFALLSDAPPPHASRSRPVKRQRARGKRVLLAIGKFFFSLVVGPFFGEVYRRAAPALKGVSAFSFVSGKWPATGATVCKANVASRRSQEVK